MLGPQHRISPSKRILDLETRAKELSSQVAYISEMNRLCAQIVHNTSAMLKLLDENTTNDGHFGNLIAEMNGSAIAKVQQCDKWLNANVPKLKKLTDELAGDK